MKTVFFTFAMITLLFLGNSSGQSNGWQYALPITIDEKSGQTLTNYAVEVTVDTQTPIADGKMDIDGKDIRISSTCNDTNFLKHFINFGFNSTTTKIWILLPSLPANGSITVYLFYGNSLATTTNTANVFTNGPHSATDSTTSVNSFTTTSFQTGFAFRVKEDIIVTHLGMNVPSGVSRVCNLWTVAGEKIVATVTVPWAPGYQYKELSKPVWLTPGIDYLITEWNSGSSPYYSQSPPGTFGKEITYIKSHYCTSCLSTDFPLFGNSFTIYGYADFLYSKKQVVTPKPTYTLGTEAAKPFADFTYTFWALDANFTATDQTGTSYKWTFGDSKSSPSKNPAHTYSNSGNFTVTLIVKHEDCADTSQQTLEVQLGMDEPKSLSQELRLYPNPNTGNFTLSLNSNVRREIVVSIFNPQGQLMRSELIENVYGKFTREYDLPGFSRGIYLMQLVTDDEVVNRRVSIH
ncbi:MAG: DUF2341 domain-containing protein [Bacteroidetes bacterium]|nr:DUF2341 domain-containing protein [Bacteroidota bacterium]